MLLALLVTFLWSSSWVLIKIGLDDLDLRPISFAGVRYALAALVLLPFGLRALRSVRTSSARAPDARSDRRGLVLVAIYGLLFVGVAQGAQFAALALLPATAVSLVLSSIPAGVALIAIGAGSERATGWQAAGIGVLSLGAVLYFGPFDVPAGAAGGFVAAGVCVAAAAASSHLGRLLARDRIGALGGALGLTAVSMAVGGAALLAIGVAVEGWPQPDARGWLIIAWLAVVNTAFAFTVWNATLRTLTAVESSVVNNTMTVQIAILAVVLLGERPDAVQVLGLLLAATGAAVVQLAPILRGRRD